MASHSWYMFILKLKRVESKTYLMSISWENDHGMLIIVRMVSTSKNLSRRNGDESWVKTERERSHRMVWTIYFSFDDRSRPISNKMDFAGLRYTSICKALRFREMPFLCTSLISNWIVYGSSLLKLWEYLRCCNCMKFQACFRCSKNTISWSRQVLAFGTLS